MRTEADAALVERAVHHDTAALSAIFDLYAGRVYAFCLTATRQHEDAEDLTALTFEQALRAIDRYCDRGVPLSAWLLRIAANAIAERGRHLKLEHAILVNNGMLRGYSGVGYEDAGLDVCIERWERANWLQQQVAALAEDQRTVVRLRYWDDLSFAEIAARMHRSEAATRKLLYRAIETLRVRLTSLEGLGDNGESRGLGDARSRGQRGIGARTG